METKICLKWLLTRGWKQWNTLNRLISKNLVAVVCWREVVLYKRLQRKLLVFWIGGRLSKRGGRTLRFDCIYVYFLSKSLLLVLWSDYNNNEEKTEQASHKKRKTFCENRLFVLAMFSHVGVLNFHDDIISLPRNQSRKGKVSISVKN